MSLEWVTLEWAVLGCAAIPAALFFRNWFVFRAPPPILDTAAPRSVSVLIPARNEEATIARAVESVLASRGVTLEVVVLDDHSTDGTAAAVARIAARDPRVRLAAAPPLPNGWCGKQHACAVLSMLASHDLLCFLDADVRLEPDAIGRAVALLETSRTALVSGFPRQETVSFAERLLLPLIHFVLLGFLPLDRMRAVSKPAYAAGCGQWMLARRDAYRRAGGHSAISTTLHDGIRLPKAFRRAGFRTTIFDATALASCRMYSGARQVWDGLAKNATEGLGHPVRIVPFTALLVGGQVLPFVLLAVNGPSRHMVAAALCALLPRLAAAWRYRQSLLSAFAHPIGIAVLLSIQWYALLRERSGRTATWKGRNYPPAVFTGRTTVI